MREGAKCDGVNGQHCTNCKRYLTTAKRRARGNRDISVLTPHIDEYGECQDYDPRLRKGSVVTHIYEYRVDEGNQYLPEELEQ